MNVLQQIEKRAYLATDAQVAELARLNHDSTRALAETRATYLRVLLAGTLEAMGLKPRLRAGKPAQAPDKDEAMAALEATHARYYAVILEAITTDDIADKPTLKKAEKSKRALERNRRSNFARTSKSVLSAYVRSGGNLCALVITTVTKAYLQSETAKRKPEVPMDERVTRAVKGIMNRIEALQEENKDIAQTVTQRLILQLSQLEGCERYTKSPKRAVQESIPLRTEAGIFIPISGAMIDGKREELTLQ